MQEVAPFFKQMAAACPNLDLHEETLQLAYISVLPLPEKASRETRAAAAASSVTKDCGAIYNLTSGERKFRLALG